MNPDQQPTSDQQPNPYWPPQPPATPAKKSRLPWLIPAGLVVVVILGVILGIAINAATVPTTTAAATTPVEEHRAEPEIGITPDPVVDTPAPGPTLHASDIKLTAKITSKHCFGSAGCNVEFKVNMAYDGPDLSADDTWEVTYEVTGVEDGPLLGSFDVTGDTYDVNEEIAGTTNSSKKISIKVTGVDKVGI